MTSGWIISLPIKEYYENTYPWRCNGLARAKSSQKNLINIIKEYQIDFSVVNGENAADDGKGITKEIAEEFFLEGIDVITSGNHIWDKGEIINFIEKESRLLRPANLAEGTPGKGFNIFFFQR